MQYRGLILFLLTVMFTGCGGHATFNDPETAVYSECTQTVWETPEDKIDHPDEGITTKIDCSEYDDSYYEEVQFHINDTDPVIYYRQIQINSNEWWATPAIPDLIPTSPY